MKNDLVRDAVLVNDGEMSEIRMVIATTADGRRVTTELNRWWFENIPYCIAEESPNEWPCVGTFALKGWGPWKRWVFRPFSEFDINNA